MNSNNHELDVQRQLLITQLTEYAVMWPNENTTIERMMEFISRVPGCFERSTEEGHLTGAAWLVNTAKTHVLLTHHRKLDKWLQLGGHADGLTDMATVAHTEAVEESGISNIIPISIPIFDIDIHPIPTNSREREHLHFDVRFAFGALDDTYTVSDESHDLVWAPVGNLSDYTQEPSMNRMAAKWKILSETLNV